jgi:hypothetical protein
MNTGRFFSFMTIAPVLVPKMAGNEEKQHNPPKVVILGEIAGPGAPSDLAT